QLLKIKDDEKLHLELQLNNYKSGIERLYSHFNLNIDSIDQVIPILEDRYQSVQTSQNPYPAISEIDDEYNSFKNKFRNYLSIENNLTLDETAQLILNYLNQVVSERDLLLKN
ncbi:unnamed protein product, partial [Rotaria magnacalcarata]